MKKLFYIFGFICVAALIYILLSLDKKDKMLASSPKDSFYLKIESINGDKSKKIDIVDLEENILEGYFHVEELQYWVNARSFNQDELALLREGKFEAPSDVVLSYFWIAKKNPAKAIDLYCSEVLTKESSRENYFIDVLLEAVLFGIHEYGKNSVDEQIIRLRQDYGIVIKEENVKSTLMKSPFH